MYYRVRGPVWACDLLLMDLCILCMKEYNNLLGSIEEEDEGYNDSLQGEENESGNNSQPAPGAGNDSPPAPGVPRDKEHSKCIEEILSLENLFPAPPAKKDDFEVIKMHAGNEDHNYARIFFEFNEGVNSEDSKRELELIKKNGGELNEDILKNVKKIVVDRSKIKGYSQGKANDEIIFNEDNKLISVSFVKKPEDDKIEEGKGLRGNTVYNKVMVLKYDNKYRGPQEFIVDMDNNLIITTDDLKLYWHSKDNNAGGTGFDDKETPVYIDSTNGEDNPMYHHFRINNAIKVKEDEQFYIGAMKWISNSQEVKADEQFYIDAMKRISDSKGIYGINYVYSDRRITLESSFDYLYEANKWRENIRNFLTEQWKNFLAIFNDKQDNNTKKKKIQEFGNFFKDCLLGHNNKLGDNIIMTSSYGGGKRVSVDDMLSHFNLPWAKEYRPKYKKMKEIFYPVFDAIKKFIQVIRREASKIDNPIAQPFQNKRTTNFEANNKSDIINEGLKDINNPDAQLLSTDNDQQTTNFKDDENEIFNKDLNKDIDITTFSTDDNQSPTTFETLKKLITCEGCCEFGLPDCLKNCLKKKG